MVSFLTRVWFALVNAHETKIEHMDVIVLICVEHILRLR